MYKKIVLSLGLLAGLTACSTDSAGGGADSGQANQMYTWLSNDSDRAQWEAFVTGVNETTGEEFDITLDGTSFVEYWTKVKTKLASNDAPCILTTQAARAQELADLLTPLDELAAKAGLDLTQYNQAMIDGMTVDGKVRAIPYDAEPMVLYYNKQMFADAGLEEPSLNYTREQFLSDAKTLTENGNLGTSLSPSPNPPFFPIAFANGHTPVKDGELDLTNEEFVADIQWAFDLAHKEGVASIPNSADPTDVAMQDFMAKEVAMVVEGPWFYSTIKEALGDDMGIAVIPSDNGTSVGMIQGSGFGISEKCPDKEAAFDNIIKMTTADVVGYVGNKRRTVPSIESAIDGWAEGKPEQDAMVVKELLANGQPLITTKNWNQVDTLFTQYSSEGARGTRTAQDILSSIQQSAK